MKRVMLAHSQNTWTFFTECDPQLVCIRNEGFFKMSLETDFTVQFCMQHMIALLGQHLACSQPQSLGHTLTYSGTAFIFDAKTYWSSKHTQLRSSDIIPGRCIYSHLSLERCPAACIPPKDIPWKLQNQRQPAACCWPGNVAQRILRWVSEYAVC